MLEYTNGSSVNAIRLLAGIGMQTCNRAAGRRSVSCSDRLAGGLAGKQWGCTMKPLWCHSGWRE